MIIENEILLKKGTLSFYLDKHQILKKFIKIKHEIILKENKKYLKVTVETDKILPSWVNDFNSVCTWFEFEEKRLERQIQKFNNFIKNTKEIYPKLEVKKVGDSFIWLEK